MKKIEYKKKINILPVWLLKSVKGIQTRKMYIKTFQLLSRNKYIKMLYKVAEI